MRGNSSKFTFGPAINAAAVWSPDGEQIAFRSTRKGLVELFLRSTAGGGTEQFLLGEEAARARGLGTSNLSPSDWSADGQIALASGIPTDLWLLSATGKKGLVRLTNSNSDQLHANFSPDSHYIAYTSNEGGRYDVYTETLPPSDRKWKISTRGGYEPRWRADGREIYYLAEDRKLMAVPVSSGARPFGVPRVLFQTEVHTGVHILRTHYVPSTTARASWSTHGAVISCPSRSRWC